jgi:hypothetical protein
MNHHDADISDVIIILHEEMEFSLDGAIERLTEWCITIGEVDRDEGAVEATVESAKLKTIEQLSFVKYIRRVFEYTADFPPGDPRNLDPDGEDSDGDVDDAGA